MLIRRATGPDAAAIAAVHLAAFNSTEEPELAASLLADGAVIAELSLVAVIDDQVVGHVVCSRGDLAGMPSVGLGPIGVLPDNQKSGVGLALMHAVIAAADAMGEPLIALLGSNVYYSRYGFMPATDIGITAPDPSWGDHFQVRTLATYEPSMRGQFSYASAFDEL